MPPEPVPCMTRDQINISMDLEPAQRPLPRMNTAFAKMKASLRPKLSLSLAYNGREFAKAMKKPVASQEDLL